MMFTSWACEPGHVHPTYLYKYYNKWNTNKIKIFKNEHICLRACSPYTHFAIIFLVITDIKLNHLKRALRWLDYTVIEIVKVHSDIGVCHYQNLSIITKKPWDSILTLFDDDKLLHWRRVKNHEYQIRHVSISN